jgi:hypothetical protein
MDDLAPAPAQRTSDDGGRTPERSFAARKKAVKKVQDLPARTESSEPDAGSEPESDHQIDLLA